MQFLNVTLHSLHVSRVYILYNYIQLTLILKRVCFVTVLCVHTKCEMSKVSMRGKSAVSCDCATVVHSKVQL